MGFSPVAIGGVGGSGTRAIANLLRKLRFHIGDELNESLDNLWFTLLFKRKELWPPEANQHQLDLAFNLFQKVMVGGQSLNDYESRLLDDLIKEDRFQHPGSWLKCRADSIRSVLSVPRDDLKERRWGWKEPNTHLFIPELLERLPGLKYIHVMRNGLDMAFSANQNQLQLWGPSLLNREVKPTEPSDSLSYWCHVHQRVKAYGSGMGDRFLLMDFDRFCADPAKHLPELVEFLEVTDVDMDSLVTVIEPPASIGRYRDHNLSGFRDEDLAFVREMGFEIS